MGAPLQHAMSNGVLQGAQEGATYVAYKTQKDKARSAGDKVLEAIFHCVGRDEAAHGGFYRSIIELELALDRNGTVAESGSRSVNFQNAE